jgi:hypothetical protein
VVIEPSDASSVAASLSVELFDLNQLSSSKLTGQTPNCQLDIKIDTDPPRAVSLVWNRSNQTSSPDLELTLTVSEPIRPFGVPGALALSPGLVVNNILPGEDGLTYIIKVRNHANAQAHVPEEATPRRSYHA